MANPLLLTRGSTAIDCAVGLKLVEITPQVAVWFMTNDLPFISRVTGLLSAGSGCHRTRSCRAALKPQRRDTQTTRLRLSQAIDAGPTMQRRSPLRSEFLPPAKNLVPPGT